MDINLMLTKFNIGTGKIIKENDFIPFKNLFDQVLLKSEIIKLSEMLNTINLMATSSIFIKRLSIIPNLYKLVSIHNIYIEFSIDDLLISIQQNKLSFHLNKYKVTKIDHTKHHEYLKQLTEFCFKTFFNPLVQTLSLITPLSSVTYYDHVAFIIDHLYTDGNNANSNNNHLYLKSLPPTTFNLDFNPINVTFEEVYIQELDKTIKLRRSCCMKYLINNDSPCYTCPHITIDERISILRKKTI